MVCAAHRLRLHPRLGNPTVVIVVDRIDRDTQISATFNAADVPNLVGVATLEALYTLLAQDVRKVLITTIHKFAEAEGRLNERSNTIVMVDEAHRHPSLRRTGSSWAQLGDTHQQASRSDLLG